MKELTEEQLRRISQCDYTANERNLQSKIIGEKINDKFCDETLSDFQNEMTNRIYDASYLIEHLERRGLVHGNGHQARQIIAKFASDEIEKRWNWWNGRDIPRKTVDGIFGIESITVDKKLKDLSDSEWIDLFSKHDFIDTSVFENRKISQELDLAVKLYRN